MLRNKANEFIILFDRLILIHLSTVAYKARLLI